MQVGHVSGTCVGRSEPQREQNESVEDILVGVLFERIELSRWRIVNGFEVFEMRCRLAKKFRPR